MYLFDGPGIRVTLVPVIYLISRNSAIEGSGEAL